MAGYGDDKSGEEDSANYELEGGAAEVDIVWGWGTIMIVFVLSW